VTAFERNILENCVDMGSINPVRRAPICGVAFSTSFLPETSLYYWM